MKALLALVLLAQPSDRLPRPPLPDPMPYLLIEPCPGGRQFYGCATYGDPATVYLAPRDVTRFTYAVRLAHELGHVIDRQQLTDRERARFTALLHRTGDPWFADRTPRPDDREREYYRRSVGERFANLYAACLVDKRLPGKFLSFTHGPRFVRKCRLIVRLTS